MREYYAKIVRSEREPHDRDVLWLRTLYKDRTDVGLYYWAINRWKLYGGGGITDEQRQKLEAIILDGDGTKYLSDDGTYHKIIIPFIIDDLTSTDTEAGLSANQGRVLKELIDNLQNLLNSLTGNVSDIQTQFNLHVAEFESFKTQTNVAISTLNTNLTSEIEARIAGDENLQTQIDTLDNTVSDNYTEFNAFRTTVNSSFLTVNNNIIQIEDRLDGHDNDIEGINSDISGILTSIAEAEHFRGSVATTAELDNIPNPTPNDFAHNYQTVTVWIYNGTTWEDTGQEIPNEAPTATNAVPLMDGVAEVGDSNEYARGDHRHPSDASKADAVDLNNYLPLAGNSQVDAMTGSIWLGSANKVYLSDSGNTYIGQDTTNQQTLLVSPGSGGVDIQTSLGTLKYNGVEVSTIDNLSTSLLQYLPLSAGTSKPLTGLLVSQSIRPTADLGASIGTTAYRYGTIHSLNYRGTLFEPATEGSNTNISYIGTKLNNFSQGHFIATYIDSIYTSNWDQTDQNDLNLRTNSNTTTTKLLYNGTEVATVDDIENAIDSIDFSNYVTLDTNQVITGVKTFSTNSGLLYSGLQAGIVFRPTSTGFGYIGDNNFRFNGFYGVTGNFTNLVLNNTDFNPADYVNRTDAQTIAGIKTFSSYIVSNQGIRPSTSGAGNIGTTALPYNTVNGNTGNFTTLNNTGTTTLGGITNIGTTTAGTRVRAQYAGVNFFTVPTSGFFAFIPDGRAEDPVNGYVMSSTALSPPTGVTASLGTSSRYWNNAYITNLVVSGTTFASLVSRVEALESKLEGDFSTFDFSTVTNISNMFAVNVLNPQYEGPPINVFRGDFPAATIAQNTFSNRSTMTSCRITLPVCTAADNIFAGTDLPVEDIVYVFESLPTYTSGIHTFGVGATNLAKLSAAQIAIATNKGWTVN